MNSIAMNSPTAFYPSTPYAPAGQPTPREPGALQFTTSGSTNQLLQGSPVSNPWSAAPLTQLQSDAALGITGSPTPKEEDEKGALDHTGTVAGSASDAGSQGFKAANASAAARAAAETAETGSHVAPALSTAGKVSKVAGPVGTVVSSGIQVFQTGSEIKDIKADKKLTEAQKEEKAGAAATEGAGSIAGGLGGAAAGAAIGAAGGPPGMIIGAVIGGLGGDLIGGGIGKAIGESPVGKLVGKLFA